MHGLKVLGAVLIGSLAVASTASAQLSVTTFGATNGQACYNDANDGFSMGTGSCDRALREDNLNRRDEASTYVNRGIIQNRAGDLADALESFDAALAINNDLAEAYLNRGNTHFLQGGHMTALDDYEIALEKGIKKAHIAWFNIGLAHDAMKNPEKAREAYLKALELSPEFALAKRKLEPADASE